MAKSIMQKDRSTCYLCGKAGGYCNPLEEHHVIYGRGNRPLSEKYGLKVMLHAVTCHKYNNGPHNNAETRKKLCQDAQRAFEEHHGTREEFMRIFGKNYL